MIQSIRNSEREESPTSRMVLLTAKDVSDVRYLLTRIIEGASSRQEAYGVINAEEPAVQDAKRLMSLLTGTTVTDSDIANSAANSPFTRLVSAARRELHRREMRSEWLPEGMFGEPAWEMLLKLYVEYSHRRLTLAKVTKLLNLPQTSALRWTRYLEDHGLVVRTPHETDKRTFYITVTPKGIAALNGYFTNELS